MPIYEYRCIACGVKYEKIVFKTDGQSPPCPHCASPEVEKLISVPGGMTGGSSGGSEVGPCGVTRAGCSSGFS
jgi:putative FmdB family regulatory protein